ncbi:NeuD/PglB/VioB family sugar acetyltransferase [Pseudolysinimonas sp.]|uniref:NeuD/PglB/VioB family sugar acetyltransferase n=1 Tax=Pseudolysinimonas sp. TaxID=2680009 RepID=UPI003F82375C
MDVLLLAAGGLAREVLGADLPGIDVIGLLDDDPARVGAEIGGRPVLGGIDLARERPEQLLVCAGSGAARRRIVERIGAGDERFATAIDASVRIPAGCTVGAGSILLAGTVLTADVTVGRHVVAMPDVVLTHDDVIADYATLAAGVRLGGGVHVGEAAYLGMSGAVRQNLRIGADALIGMGAVVLRDVPPGETWVGVPAEKMGDRS